MADLAGPPIPTPTAARLSNAYQNWYRFSRNPTAVIGAAIVIVCILAAIFAPLITPYPNHVGAVVNFRAPAPAAFAAHWFGTDNVGRDILTRVIFGYRVSLLLVVVVLGIAGAGRRVLGMLAGYFGGWVEIVIMRVTDIALAIPPLVMALAVAAVLSPSLVNSMLADRGAVVDLAHAAGLLDHPADCATQEFVEAAETLGASKFHILFREILPNCVSAIAVKTSLDAGFVILVGASLSLPRPRHPAADARPRHDGVVGRVVPAGRLVGIGAARLRHPVRRARLQPARRRPARPLRRAGRQMSAGPAQRPRSLASISRPMGSANHVLHGVSLDVPRAARRSRWSAKAAAARR